MSGARKGAVAMKDMTFDSLLTVAPGHPPQGPEQEAEFIDETPEGVDAVHPDTSLKAI